MTGVVGINANHFSALWATTLINFGIVGNSAE
jgi:hypothetical protein